MGDVHCHPIISLLNVNDVSIYDKVLANHSARADLDRDTIKWHVMRSFESCEQGILFAVHFKPKRTELFRCIGNGFLGISPETVSHLNKSINSGFHRQCEGVTSKKCKTHGWIFEAVQAPNPNEYRHCADQ